MNVKEERKFLHDISTPISSVFFLLDMVIEKLSQDQSHNEEELKMLNTATKSMNTVKDLIQKRREILIERDSEK